MIFCVFLILGFDHIKKDMCPASLIWTKCLECDRKAPVMPSIKKWTQTPPPTHFTDLHTEVNKILELPEYDFKITTIKMFHLFKFL